MKNTFTYTSLHDYLETALCQIENPSNEQIKKAKREYWKQYYTHYRRQKRKLRKEYTLGFTAEHLQHIKNKKGDLSVSQFLYKVVEEAIRDMPSQSVDASLLGNIDRQLMHLIDLVEEMLESDSSSLNNEILEQIEILEDQFSQLFKLIKQ